MILDLLLLKLFHHVHYVTDGWTDGLDGQMDGQSRSYLLPCLAEPGLSS